MNKRRDPWVSLWDGVAFLLVAFPLLTGGIWIARPGLFIELCDLAVPVLLTTLLGAGLSLRGHDLSQGVFFKLFDGLWKNWQFRLNGTRALKTLIGVSVGVGLVWFAASLKRHLQINNHVMDMSIFYNAIWNFAHGNGYISSPKGGVNLFTDHQSPLFLLFAPAIRLFPSPITLLFIQDLGLSTGAIAAYFLAKQYLKRDHWGVSALPLLYLAYLPLRNAAYFDFHPETLMLPLFLFALVGIQSPIFKSRCWGAALFCLALAAKESAPPLAMGIGLAWILGAGPPTTRNFCRKAGAGAITLGISVFYLDVHVLPSYFGTNYAYQNQYAHFGKKLSDLFLAPLLQPKLFFSMLLRPSRLNYLFWTIGPLGFLSLWNPLPLLASIPSYLMLFLAEGDHRVQIIWHYGAEPAVGLFWAMPLAFERFKLGNQPRPHGRRSPEYQVAQRGVEENLFSDRGRSLPLLHEASREALWVLFWALLLFGRSDLFKVRPFFDTSQHTAWLKNEFIPSVNPDASYSAPIALSSHLASRYWISFYPTVSMPHGQSVQCIVQDLEIRNRDLEPGFNQKFLKSLPELGYREIYSCGESFKVFEKKDDSILASTSKGSKCLKFYPKCNPRQILNALL